jgi:hypothetical protein
MYLLFTRINWTLNVFTGPYGMPTPGKEYGYATACHSRSDAAVGPIIRKSLTLELRLAFVWQFAVQ